MFFEPGGIYHIYNQGNNKQSIFFKRENYLFFLRKIRTHILPYGDLLAYCLMPNHFHLMVEVMRVELTEPLPLSRSATLSRTPTGSPDLNHSIGIMLTSYTRAINIQENRTGSLFRQKTKAICLNELHGFASDWYSAYGITFLKVSIPEWQYPQVCFNYIHNNPVKARIVKNPGDWEFSSYPELKGLSKDCLVNRKRVDELGLSLHNG